MHLAVEICVVGVESALAAAKGGADRVELCEYLSVGGVTPSAGAIGLACRELMIPVHVLIRPRAGDFIYSALDLEVMERDVEIAKSLGAAGVVLGILHADGSVNVEHTSKLLQIARPMSVTFHKAFDECPDPEAALEALCTIGVDRILTSGQRPTAREGIPLLVKLMDQAKGRLVIMAGGRIAEADAASLIEAGLREIHIGSNACEDGRTSASKVRRFVDMAHQQSQP